MFDHGISLSHCVGWISASNCISKLANHGIELRVGVCSISASKNFAKSTPSPCGETVALFGHRMVIGEKE
jgi:hypothetical protein